MESSLIRQYNEQKQKHSDSILFFRVGEFYEMFGDDARLVSELLSLTLTARGTDENGAPMALCGVPAGSAEVHIAALVAAGYRVALCEQLGEDGSGLRRRGVVRVVGPGTLLDSAALDGVRNNYIAAVYLDGDGAGFAAADVSTGVLYATEHPGGTEADLLRELGCYAPREALLSPAAATEGLCRFLRERLRCVPRYRFDSDFDRGKAAAAVARFWEGDDLRSLGLAERPHALKAVGALLCELEASLFGGANRLRLHIYQRGQYLEMDTAARDSLELFAGSGGDKKHSLLACLDECVTSMGSRMLRCWLEKPLTSPAHINNRSDAVEELYARPAVLDALRDALRPLPDMERMLGRLVYNQGGVKELLALRTALEQLPKLQALLQEANADELRGLRDGLDALPELCGMLVRALCDGEESAGLGVSVFKEGFHAGADDLRSEIQDINRDIRCLEEAQRNETGIKSLRLGRHKLYGFYLELPKAQSGRVTGEYRLLQSLSGHERYAVPALKDLEARLLTAEGALAVLEAELLAELRLFAVAQTHRIQRCAQAAAQLDVFGALAYNAVRHGYVRPMVDHSDALVIVKGRHPTVERLSVEAFVPNDTPAEALCPAAIVTGPNMAGKSTYLRQCALVVIMAQMGGFVPADSAHIGVCDRIFTRIGASDDLAGGRSTFMVEMQEVAQILRHATRRSLIILDEVGRGTATYDGMSVAQAVLEHIVTNIGAKTLFATHYRELCALEHSCPGVRNYHVAAERRGDALTFLRRILPGAAEGSFGVTAAALAGLPDAVVERAKDILDALEGQGSSPGFSESAAGLPLEAARILEVLNGGALPAAETLRLLGELLALIKTS